MPEIAFECRAATDAEREFTAARLREHTEAAIGLPVEATSFGLLAHEKGAMVGSIVGKIFFNWLHVDLIWVADTHRRQGVGRELMHRAQERAVALGLSGIEVWTQSWQAPEFYRKLGYEELAAIDDFTPGRKRHIFRRYLTEKTL